MNFTLASLNNPKHYLIYNYLILFFALLTYGIFYIYPSGVFWDENYHIASAYKYLEGIMYMEPHPPLGKLFIALGEWILHPNQTLDTASFVRTDYIKNFPSGFSFAGVRLFPTIFGVLSALLFFNILYRIRHHLLLAFLFSALYLCANAFIVQSRAAMLESTQMFFIFATVLYFLSLFDKHQISLWQYFILGILMGLAVSTKLNGLIIILLFLFLYLHLGLKNGFNLPYFVTFFIHGLVVVSAMATVFFAVFYLHFTLAGTMGVKSYKASTAYKEILKEGSTSNPSNFFIMMHDNYRYMTSYSKGVPRFDPCKEGENGSLAYSWPVGDKSINYRWDKYDTLGVTRYLNLQINPMIWFSVIVAVIVSIALIIARLLFGLHLKDYRLFFLILTFTSIYLSYMFVMLQIERVMYLYHYFIPLFFGTFLVYLLFSYIFQEEIANGSKLLLYGVGLFVIEIIYCYLYFAPMTYYWMMTPEAFIHRSWFDFWHLKPVF